MKHSLRAKRKARHHKRLGQSSKLNLVSLMDIFTILVFFLMVNQSEVRVLQNSKDLQLPVSVAEQLPHENIVISVFKDSVLVQERLIWQQKGTQNTDANGSNVSKGKKVNEKLSEEAVNNLVAALETELTYQSTKRPQLTEQEQQKGRAVTIIGDASVEYDLLKQIMAVCATADYRNMSLAVEQIASKSMNNGGA